MWGQDVSAKADELGSRTTTQGGKGGRSGERGCAAWGHTHPIYMVIPSAKAGPRLPVLPPSMLSLLPGVPSQSPA